LDWIARLCLTGQALEPLSQPHHAFCFLPPNILHLTPDTLALWFGRLAEMNSDEFAAGGIASWIAGFA
jgi:hypothetical protein